MHRLILLKNVLFCICLIPFLSILYLAYVGQLGANPIEFVTFKTGEWALRFLLITLAVTPLNRLLALPKLVIFRRMLGLYAFFYACLHFLTYLVLDQFFAWHFIWEDMIKRPYIIVGFIAFVLLIPLAVTSTNQMMRRLGVNWKKLHRLVYVIGILAVLHFFMLVKADYLEPLIYGAILIVLLLFRVFKR